MTGVYLLLDNEAGTLQTLTPTGGRRPTVPVFVAELPRAERVARAQRALARTALKRLRLTGAVAYLIEDGMVAVRLVPDDDWGATLKGLCDELVPTGGRVGDPGMFWSCHATEAEAEAEMDRIRRHLPLETRVVGVTLE